MNKCNEMSKEVTIEDLDKRLQNLEQQFYSLENDIDGIVSSLLEITKKLVEKVR